MQGVHLRKYNAATNINFELYEVDGVDLRVDAVHASGDTTIMKDNGAEANTGSGFVDEGNGYSLALTATEMSAARIVIYIIDQTATKVWLDKTIIIETYGNASAQHAFDLDTATQGVNMTEVLGVAVSTTTAQIGTNVVQVSGDATAATNLEADYDGTGYDKSASTIGTTTTNTDMRGTNSAALASVCTEGRLAELDAGNIPTDLTNIEADTQDLQTQIGAAGAGLGDLGGMSTAMKAEILVEVNAAIDTAISELGVAAPTATPTLRTGMMLMYMALRNKLVVQTSGTDAIEIYNDAGTKIAAKTITDDGSDYTEAEMA